MLPQRAAPLADEESERASKRARYGAASLLGRYRETGLMRKDGPQSSSFLGSSSGIYFVRSVYKALQNGAQPPQSGEDVPGEDDRLASRKVAEFWTTTEACDRPFADFDLLKKLSDEYFDHWHTIFPFILAPSVLQTFDRIVQTPLQRLESTIDEIDLAIVRSIFSISAADRRQCGSRIEPVPKQLLFNSYEHAMQSVQSHLSQPASLHALQAVLAVQLFLVSMLRHNAAMRLSGLAVRMVFQLGLHRCPARYSTFNAEEVQLRKRVFWTAYCLDRMLCQSLGLPLGIKDDDTDVCSFDCEKHAVVPNTTLPPQFALLTFLARHAEIKGLIVELCNKNIDQRPVNTQARATVEEAMTRWQNEMDGFLDLHLSDSALQKGRKAALDAIRHECIIALNRPLLALSKDTADYKQALQTCITAARAIIVSLHSSLLTHLAKLASRDAGKALTPLFWPSFTWMVWISAFIVLYATVEGEMQLDVAKQLVQKSIEVLDHIAMRCTYWPNLCAAAIKDLSSKLATTQHDDMAVSADLPLIVDEFQPWAFDPSLEANDVALFDGFDIPFWLGDDQYSGMTDFWNIGPGMQ